jgi:ribosomal protein L4
MELKDEIFNIDIKPEVVHQVFVSIASNQREPIAHTKDRGEVRAVVKNLGNKKELAALGMVQFVHFVGWRWGHFWPSYDRNYKTKINKKTKNWL